MPNLSRRLLAAAPDTITALLFLLTWIDPTLPGPNQVKALMLTMLIEFVVMHSGVFYAAIAGMNYASRLKRASMFTGLTLFYSTFIVGFAFAFDSVWPIYAFAWLFVSRFLHIWISPAHTGRSMDPQLSLWVFSAAMYVLGVFATVLLPLPRFGITPEFVAMLHLKGSGEWIDRPYVVLAFGFFYFAAQAAFKYKVSDASEPVSTTPLR